MCFKRAQEQTEREGVKAKKSYLHSKATHSQMGRNDLLMKLDEQKNAIQDLKRKWQGLGGKKKKYSKTGSDEVDKVRSSEISDFVIES